jgi:cytochrome c oxidase subunit IV
MEPERPEATADAQGQPEAVHHEPDLDHHPSPRDYVKVAVILAIATAIEVAWYYVDVPKAVFITALLVLAVFKFALVVMWFMHLRFDNPIFRRLFVAGLDLAVVVYLVVLVIFGALEWGALVVSVILIAALPVAALLLRSRRRLRAGAASVEG